jgi:branched-chain amino acid transport system permease protein
MATTDEIGGDPMKFNLLPDVLLNTVVLGAVYALAGLGWVLVFRASRIFNFATGQFLLLSGYLFYTLTITHGLSFTAGLVGMLVLISAIGAATYLGMLRPLTGRPVFTSVILTLGLAIVLTRVVRLIWGGETLTLKAPIKNTPHRLIGGAVINNYGIITIIVAAVFVTAVMLFFRYTRVGIFMRAAAESPLLATQRGINVTVANALGWAMAMVAVSFAALSQAYNIGLSPSVDAIGFRGLIPALIGGFDSVGGTVLGAVAVALIENLLVLYVGAPVRDAAAFLVVFVILIIRPYGFFGTAEVRRV